MKKKKKRSRVWFVGNHGTKVLRYRWELKGKKKLKEHRNGPFLVVVHMPNGSYQLALLLVKYHEQGVVTWEKWMDCVSGKVPARDRGSRIKGASTGSRLHVLKCFSLVIPHYITQQPNEWLGDKRFLGAASAASTSF